MAEPGGDRPRHRDIPGKKDARPTIAELRGRVAGGEGVHNVIHSVLQADSTALGDFWHSRLLSGIPRPPLDPAIADLYDIDLAGGADADTSDSLRNLNIIGGFSYAVSYFHEDIVRAGSPRRERKSALDEPLIARVLNNMDRFDAEKLLADQDMHAASADIADGELRAELERDPSGIEWLRRRVKEEFVGSPDEAYGANRAVDGVAKLYHLLTSKGQQEN